MTDDGIPMGKQVFTHFVRVASHFRRRRYSDSDLRLAHVHTECTTLLGFHHEGHEHSERNWASVHRRRRPRPGIVRRIEIHEDQNYRWWWTLYDSERVAVHGPYDTKHDAKRAAHVQESHVHVATIPWKLP